MRNFTARRFLFAIVVASALFALCGLSACALIDGLSSSDSSSDSSSEDSDGNPTNPSGSCEDACSALLADACIAPINCAAACTQFSSTEKSAIIYCEARRSGCQFTPECLGDIDEPDPLPNTPDVPGCVQVCEDMSFFSCIDDTTHTQCSEICGTASAQSIEDFKECNEFACTGSGCFDAFRAANN